MRKLMLVGGLLSILHGVYRTFKPEILQVGDLSTDLQEWHDSGFYQEVYGRKIFVKTVKCSNQELKDVPTVILIHGFPSSSWDYHKALPLLTQTANVVLFDHLGFGFSDKPGENVSYGMMELADHSLELWRLLGIKKAHIVSHDMGDSVLAEILTRRYRQLLPDYFNTFFQSITFTNGGMRVNLQSHRISQKLLLLPYLGSFFSSFAAKLKLQRFSNQQLRSLWGRHSEAEEMERDIAEITKMNQINAGHTILHKLIRYLLDRYAFEPRWLEALSKLDLPCQIVWGEVDPVSPLVIAQSIHSIVPNSTLHVMKGIGHFLMLEDPQSWGNHVLNFIRNT